MNSLEQIILAAWDQPDTRTTPEVIAAIEQVVASVDAGELRTAEPTADGSWQVNEWVKKAIVMYFPIRQMTVSEVGIFEYHVAFNTASNTLSNPMVLALALFCTNLLALSVLNKNPNSKSAKASAALNASKLIPVLLSNNSPTP